MEQLRSLTRTAQFCKSPCLRQQKRVYRSAEPSSWQKTQSYTEHCAQSLICRAATDNRHSSSRPALLTEDQAVNSSIRPAVDSAPAKAPTISTQLQQSAAPGQGPPDNRWYTVIGLSALAALICSVDRAAISVAILPMSEQYHWSDSTKGAINR